MNISKLLPYPVMVLLGFVLSCKDRREPSPDCGCNGTTVEKIVNKEVTRSNNFFLINPNEQNLDLKYAFSCDLDSLATGNEIDLNTYIISGNIKNKCKLQFTANVLLIPGRPIEITSIRKK
jgi:hypothetical protein